MPKRVLVTGGSGFIGSCIVDKLVQDDYEVAVVDICLPQADIKNPQVSYAQLDIRDTGTDLVDFFNFFRPEYVIHCAALARIQPSFDTPRDYYDVNVMGTLNMLELSREFEVKKFIYSASSSVYGQRLSMPLKEACRPEPLNVYADSKLMGEMLVYRYANSLGLNGCSLRYFNVYGPRQPSEGRYATVIGIFLKQWERNEPFTIVPDGEQTRDFTWVGDVALANISAITSKAAKDGEVFNIGTGRSYSILEVAKIIGGPDHQLKFVDPRRGEAKRTQADKSKAQDRLRWRPNVSLENGIELLKKVYG